MSSLEERKKKFIKRAKSVHGSKYDYSEIDFTNAHTKVSITCQEHGPWLVTPASHTDKKSGCPECAGNKRYTKETLINKCKDIHKNLYSYKRVDTFLGVNTMLQVVCPTHGVFIQIANNHLNGQGCPECAGNIILTCEEFLKRSKSMHKDKYDYSKSEYVDSKASILILCPEHGEFWQIPYIHWKGGSCPMCAYNFKQGSIKRRKITYQGYEMFGIEWILQHTNIKLSEIYESKFPKYKKRPPTFTYLCPESGKLRKYLPDLWVPSRNIIVEIKSIYTLGAKSSDLRDINEAKKQAVLNAGYRYKLLIMDCKGNRIKRRILSL
jgi:hypothetical protein